MADRTSTNDTGTGEKCEYCEKKLTSKWYLTEHVRKVHANEQPFQCDYCDKKFAWKSSWKKHLTIHTRNLDYIDG